jgi:hypothetical protein
MTDNIKRYDTTSRFSSLFCSGEVHEYNGKNMKYDIIVKGTISEPVIDGEIRYLAASSADRRASYSGSGFPFHNVEQAFSQSPNKGSFKLIGNAFEIPLVFPNSYYIQLGRELVPPTLFINYKNLSGEKRVVEIKLSDPIPYRFLGYPSQFTLARNGAEFYHAHHNLPVRSQEQVLRDSAYPLENKMNEDFWGLKPAL